jgi:Ca2+-binding EF-hand superfamily protein
MRGLRDPLSQRRIAMIQKVFAMLDKDRSAQITFSDVANIYDVSMHPDFLARKKTKDEIVREFLNSFDGARGNNDGVLTWDEFVDYYGDLSMAIPSDEYFV